MMYLNHIVFALDLKRKMCTLKLVISVCTLSERKDVICKEMLQEKGIILKMNANSKIQKTEQKRRNFLLSDYEHTKLI